MGITEIVILVFELNKKNNSLIHKLYIVADVKKMSESRFLNDL